VPFTPSGSHRATWYTSSRTTARVAAEASAWSAGDTSRISEYVLKSPMADRREHDDRLAEELARPVLRRPEACEVRFH
jgi:hypothetical protein